MEPDSREMREKRMRMRENGMWENKMRKQKENRKRRKWIQVLSALAMCTLWCAGCADGKVQDTQTAELIQEEGQEEQPGWQKHAQDPVTLDWYINFSWYTTPWGENAVSKKMEEETGIHIDFSAPMGNENEKLDALITSNTLPDIITLDWSNEQVDEMINNGMVYALNELAEQYDPYFFEVTDEQVRSWYTREDGNLYCYPNSTFTPADYEGEHHIASNQTFLVRKDIYEAIGSPDMTTPEGFKQAVRAAAEQFPEVDGQPMIPIGAHAFDKTGCASFDRYLQNYLAIPYEKDGAYYDRYTDPEYIRWLKTFRELGAEGYLKEDIFLDQRTQMEEKIEQGRYFCMLYQRTDMEKQQKELYSKNPNCIYMAVDGPKNSSGDDPVLTGNGLNGWTATLISKNCERPDRALELFSYLISEHGQKMTYLGVEGVTYDMVDGKAVIKPEVEALLERDRMEYDRIYGADSCYWMFQNHIVQRKWRGELQEPLKQLEEWTYPYTHYMAQYEVSFDANTEAGNAYMKIQQAWGIHYHVFCWHSLRRSLNDCFRSLCKRERNWAIKWLWMRVTGRCRKINRDWA